MAEDKNQHFLIASGLRLLRWAALALSLIFPALFVAVAMYHQEMIPTRLLQSMIAAKQDVPFSVVVEVLTMLAAFELLMEAGIRLPDPVGDTVSIIGALIVGQSAVEAKVLSPIVIIVVAAAGIGGYAQPSQELAAAVRLWRLALVAGAASVMMALYARAAVGLAVVVMALVELVAKMRAANLVGHVNVASFEEKAKALAVGLHGL